MTREPDRFEAKARHVTERCRYHDTDTPFGFACVECIAAALQQSAAPAAETERFFPGAAEAMGEPPSEPVAPEPDRYRSERCSTCGSANAAAQFDCPDPWHNVPAPPVEPSLLPRVLAALESYADLTQSTTLDREIRALAAELRRYIATDPRDKRIAELEAALSDWRAVEAECGAVDCHCGCHVHATDLADGGEPPK